MSDDVLKDILQDGNTEDETSDVIFDVIIPENPTLEDIAKIALIAYKDQMSDIQLMTPKYRARSLEVANMFLGVAKDALSKKEDVNHKVKELDFKKETTAKAKTPADGDNIPATRKELLLELHKKTAENNNE